MSSCTASTNWLTCTVYFSHWLYGRPLDQLVRLVEEGTGYAQDVKESNKENPRALGAWIVYKSGSI